MNADITLFKIIEKYFPLIALFFSVSAYFQPGGFVSLKPHIPLLLGIIMFTMGASLTTEDFFRVRGQWKAVLGGSALQFTVMPLVALALTKVFNLPPMYAIGLILVGSCPGGTASNVICYLARADLALSVTMTLFSTVLAPLATPAITWALAGHWVPVPVGALFQSILSIVILPLGAGFLVNRFAGKLVERVRVALPSLSIAAIVAIIACVVALNRDNLSTMPVLLMTAVAIHNLTGFAAGYFLASIVGAGESTRRTLAIEVGMQNSGLGVSLAVSFFGALASVPGAIFSVWQNLAGSVLAGWWRSRR